MTWLTRKGSAEQLLQLEKEFGPQLPQQSWQVVRPDGSEVAVYAASLTRAADDALVATGPDQVVSEPGQWLLFYASRKAHMKANGPRRRTTTTSKKTAKSSRAMAALKTWQMEQEPRPGAMYGRVLLDDAKFAAGKNGVLYVYERGVYVAADEYVEARLQDLAGIRWSRHLRNETMAWLYGHAPGIDEKSPGPDTINVSNGLLKWNGSRWQLKPHDPEVRTTVQLPVAYDPKAECPRYDAFLESSVPDADTRNFLDEWSGYNLTSDCRHQKAFMAGGADGSGKSQYLFVLGALLGDDNTTAIPLQSLVHDKFAPAGLYCKLANICADISSSELRATGEFKMLTGGDKIKGEKKYQDPFYFLNTAKLSFSANEIPATRDVTSAYFDRWIVALFPQKFRGTKAQIKDIGANIAADLDEMSGVLNRALRGLTRLRKNDKFTTGREMRAAQAEFLREANPVALWLMDVLRDADGKVVKERREKLFPKYDGWCRLNNNTPLASRRLYAQLRKWAPTEDVVVRTTMAEGYEWFHIEDPKEK